jgi:hypothetical protein
MSTGLFGRPQRPDPRQQKCRVRLCSTPGQIGSATWPTTDPADDIPWYAPGHHRVGIPRQRQPGEEVWRLRDPVTGRVQTCELRDDTTVGAGWDVLILEGDEPLFSRRCVDERGARYVAQSFKQDILRTGWSE